MNIVMKTRNILLGTALVLTYGMVFAQTPTADESPCNKHYETAIKFTVDTPVIHPFTVSKNTTTGKIGKVIFSPGALQYCPSYQHIVPTATGQRCETISDFFRFAIHQYDRCTNGIEVNDWSNGNVWYDSVVKADAPSYLGGDSFYYVKRKCTNAKDAVLGTPNGITNSYHGWNDIFVWGSSCQGLRANDPFTYQFKPYECSKTSTGNAANPYGIGPSFYDPTDTNKPANWIVGNINRNNIDTNSGLSRYFDWGYANIIREYKECTQLVNGNKIHTWDSTAYTPGTWRTLTKDEWEYLMNKRVLDGVEGNTWINCVVEDTTLHQVSTGRYIPGVMILPDDFDQTLLDAPKLNRRTWDSGQQVSASDFKKYEDVGCVFIASTGYREQAVPDYYCAFCDCFCWTATAYNTTLAYSTAYFWRNTKAVGNDIRAHDRSYSFAVRLVQDL